MSRFILVNRYFHPDESATSLFLTDLARHLAARHSVQVLASRQLLEQADAHLPEAGALEGIHIRRLWSTEWGRRWLPGRLADYLSFLAAVAVWLLLHSRRGDVVLAKTDPPLLGVVTTLATLGRGVKRVQWLQDLYPETASRLGVVGEGRATQAVRALRDWSLRHSHLVVTVSAGMGDHLRDRVGTARLVHVPNWADNFPAATPPGQNDRLTVGYSGNLGRAHPIAALLQLAEIATDPDLRFLITGGGANHERLRDRVQQLQRANWSFLPYQPRPEVAALLQRSDLHLVLLDPRVERFVFPSKVYGILSAGRPILHLGDPDGEVARLVREHGCGWSLPADSGTAVLALLRDLQQHPEKLRMAGQAARQAYLSRYSHRRALDAWDGALQTV